MITIIKNKNITCPLSSVVKNPPSPARQCLSITFPLSTLAPTNLNAPLGQNQFTLVRIYPVQGHILEIQSGGNDMIPIDTLPCFLHVPFLFF